MQFQLGRFFLLHQFLDIFHCSLSCICFAVCSACLKCMYSTTYPNRDNSHLHNGLFIMGNHQKLIWMIVRHSEVPVCLTDPDVPPCFHPTTLILYTFDNEPQRRFSFDGTMYSPSLKSKSYMPDKDKISFVKNKASPVHHFCHSTLVHYRFCKILADRNEESLFRIHYDRLHTERAY